MSKRIEINSENITRVEGHGNIVVKAHDGKIEKVEWQVPEAPRFFEAILRGRDWQEVQTVVSRVCGICSISHSLAAVKAIEAAMNIEISEQTKILRLLTLYAEVMQSHILHIGYMAAPDFLGAKSIIPLVESNFETVKLIIKLHRTANKWAEMLAGRSTHPVTIRPGGFTKVPSQEELIQLKGTLLNVIPDISVLAETLLGAENKLPPFERETEYVALVDGNSYAFYGGEIGSSINGENVPADEFEFVVNEYITAQSTAKWAKWHGESYAVGALARYNHNRQYLKSNAQNLARLLGLGEKCINPYRNTFAQLVEVLHMLEHAVEIIDNLLDEGIKQEKPLIKPRAGIGVGCVEAPRGILFHCYEFNNKGICTSANLCIPTSQNHGNIQKDLEHLVPQIIEKDEEEIRFMLEALVRAYDPCISCSTHYLDVRFENE